MSSMDERRADPEWQPRDPTWQDVAEADRLRWDARVAEARADTARAGFDRAWGTGNYSERDVAPLNALRSTAKSAQDTADRATRALVQHACGATNRDVGAANAWAYQDWPKPVAADVHRAVVYRLTAPVRGAERDDFLPLGEAREWAPVEDLARDFVAARALDGQSWRDLDVYQRDDLMAMAEDTLYPELAARDQADLDYEMEATR